MLLELMGGVADHALARAAEAEEATRLQAPRAPRPTPFSEANAMFAKMCSIAAAPEPLACHELYLELKDDVVADTELLFEEMTVRTREPGAPRSDTEKRPTKRPRTRALMY